MPDRSDPRCPVQLAPCVTLPCQNRFPRVQTHPHPDRPSGKRPLTILAGRQRGTRLSEHVEERVPLRIHLDPAVGTERFPQDATMLRERLHVTLLTKLVDQPRRALDIRKEKGDSPNR